MISGQTSFTKPALKTHIFGNLYFYFYNPYIYPFFLNQILNESVGRPRPFLHPYYPFFISAFAKAQTDTIFFNENNIIVGEVKEMNRGILIIETDYSDKNFEIEWVKVKRFKSEQHFNIALSDRRNIQHVEINSIDDGKIAIAGETGGEIVAIEDIVYLRQLKEDLSEILTC